MPGKLKVLKTTRLSTADYSDGVFVQDPDDAASVAGYTEGAFIGSVPSFTSAGGTCHFEILLQTSIDKNRWVNLVSLTGGSVEVVNSSSASLDYFRYLAGPGKFDAEQSPGFAEHLRTIVKWDGDSVVLTAEVDALLKP